MARQVSSFVCPVIKQQVEMRVGYASANLLSEVHSCSGSEVCGVTSALLGRDTFEWKHCPVLRSHLGIPGTLNALFTPVQPGL